MNHSMITASVTMGQLQRKLDTISHNVSNVNTNGFKRRDVQFQDLLFQQLNNQPVENQEIGRNTPYGIRVGSGARVSQTNLKMEQGSIILTGRSLDLALSENNVFFEVTKNDGERFFTRDGAFYLTPNLNNPDEVFLVTGDGDYVLSSTGEPISIPASHNSILITDTGRVDVFLNDGTQLNVDQLQLTKITKPQLLQNTGDNLFTIPNLEELGMEEIFGIVEKGGVIQGSLESSNVDLGKEMSELILAQRAYQFNTRSISIADQMMGLVNNIRG